MKLCFSSLTLFKPVSGQTLKGGCFYILLGTVQPFAGGIQIQLP